MTRLHEKRTKQMADENSEFFVQYDTVREIWVKHRASGHVYQFTISNGYEGLMSSYRITPNFASQVSPATLSTRAKRFAYNFLARTKKRGI
jgi:hypothetical protein